MSNRELILLALDESQSLHLMERALQAADYDVAVAHDHDGLIKALDESSPSLLLIGEIFNSGRGVEIASEQLDRFPTLPILLFADKDTTGLAKAVLAAGLSGYLYPPLKTDDIVAAVKRSLERARHLGDWVRREVKRTTASLENRASISEAEQARLESIINNIEDGVIVLDDNLKIMLVNRVAREAFALGEANFSGKLIKDVIIHPDLHAMLAKSAESVIKYYEINFDDGRVFNAQHTPIPNIGSAVTMQDITYLKRLDQMKNDFVHTVSHDLRSPLTAVLGYAELVERVGPLTEQQKEFLHRVQGSVQNITTLVNDLLDLGRLESGFDTRRETVQLENVLQYSLGLLDSLIQKKNIHLKQEIAPGLPALRANPIRVRQMIDNLIGNAIKYAPEDGEIGISIRSEANQVILQVSDNGPGIPRDEQGRIFDKFYRGSNVAETKGTGLGLAIVKSIVDSHHGRVWVESILGRGASFCVVLPAAES
ncbi:MAG: PAS domain-containing protein [Chloroflexi bacterium]|nr:PAS domain-containing protein [Chloroflexota bacterium]